MSSTRTKIGRGAVALACLLGLGGTALADTIVVRSGGPSARAYPAGKTLAPRSRITLAKGDTLTVLDSKGTRTLVGPGNFSAEASASAATNRGFASLISTQNRRRARTGAVRTLGQRALPPSLWYADIERGTTMCLANPADFQLWRPDMEKAASFTVTPEKGGAATAVRFAVGQNSASWPAALPITEGAGYTVSGGGLAKPVKLRFAMLGQPVSDPLGAYNALKAKGCAAQLDVMMETMAQSEAANPVT